MAFHSAALKDALANLELDSVDTGFAVALSGGADSMALLVALSECMSADRILALHFNHGIHTDSPDWIRHCREICVKKQIRFLVENWTEKDPSVRKREASAREARYQWFVQVLPKNYVLLTGHHLDDQAETVLMNLAEGRSLDRVAGISAMRQLRFGDPRKVVRPLLGFRHVELQQYLQEKDFEWVEDPANRDPRHSRSLVRQKVMPILTGRWPKAAESIDRLARELADTLAIVDSMAGEIIDTCQQPQRSTLFCRATPLQLTPLMALSAVRFNAVLRSWIHQASKPSPGGKQLAEFYRQLISVSPESHCQLRVDGFEIVYFDNHLFLIKSDTFVVEEMQEFNPHERIICPGLEFDLVDGPKGIAPEYMTAGKLHWRKRRNGDRFVVSDQSGTASLKKTMQGLRLAPWLRQSLPVLACDDDVVWAHGVGVHARYQGSDYDQTGKAPRLLLAT